MRAHIFGSYALRLNQNVGFASALACLISIALGCGKPAPSPATEKSSPSNGQAADLAALDLLANSLEELSAKLTRSPSGEITAVDLRSVDVTDATAELLSKLSKLTRLTIDTSSMSDVGWKHLMQLGELQHLDLRDCAVNNQQLSTAVSGMPKLRSLRLSGKTGATTVDDGGLEILDGCPNLVLLALDGLWVSEAGLKHIAAPDKMLELYLAQTLVEDTSMETIANMKALKKLRLANNGITNSGLALIEALPLEDLDISECSQLDDGAMASVGKLQGLKRLNVWRDAITDEGVEKLAGLTSLEWLNLDNTRLTDTGLPSLNGMSRLSFLHLGSTLVTDAGMPHLVGLKALKDLKVTRTAVTDAGVQVLRDAIPGIDIQLKYIEGE